MARMQPARIKLRVELQPLSARAPIANGRQPKPSPRGDGATAQQTKAPQRPCLRYGADEIDFALRNISGNTQLSAGMRRAWPSLTASCSEMRDRYWRVLNIRVELFEAFATLDRPPYRTRWSHAHLCFPLERISSGLSR